METGPNPAPFSEFILEIPAYGPLNGEYQYMGGRVNQKSEWKNEWNKNSNLENNSNS